MIFSLVAMTGLEKCCITSAYLQWLCHSGERPVARGPLVFLGFFHVRSLWKPQQCVIYVYFFIKFVIKWSENSVRFEFLMGIAFQMDQNFVRFYLSVRYGMYGNLNTVLITLSAEFEQCYLVYLLISKISKSKCRYLLILSF